MTKPSESGLALNLGRVGFTPYLDAPETLDVVDPDGLWGMVVKTRLVFCRMQIGLAQMSPRLLFLYSERRVAKELGTTV